MIAAYAGSGAVLLGIAAVGVAGVGPSDQNPTAFVAPAFFDPQINGCLGVSFNSRDLTPDQVRTVADECRRHGIGAFCPTLVTGGFDALRHGFATLAAAIDSDPELARRIPAFHLEGPYLSAEDGPRGAHPREHIRDPDCDEFRRWQDAARGEAVLAELAEGAAGLAEGAAGLAGATTGRGDVMAG